jgi:hypothetical protein
LTISLCERFPKQFARLKLYESDFGRELIESIPDATFRVRLLETRFVQQEKDDAEAAMPPLLLSVFDKSAPQIRLTETQLDAVFRQLFK